MDLAPVLQLCLFAHAAALLFWFGALCLTRVLGVGHTPGERRAMMVAAALALLSGATWPWLQTGIVLDEPLAALDPQRVFEVLTQTSFGRTWLARQAIIALAVLAAMAPLLSASRALLFLVAVSLASLALIGHAAAAGPVEQLTQATHLLAAGAWLGALPLLWLRVRRLAPRDMALLLRRFSGYGIVLVSMVVMTGALSAWYRSGSLGVLLASAYGRVLLAKVGCVALMGVAALANRNWLTPGLELGQDTEAAQRALRWSIGAESALGLVVIALAVALAAAEAPR